MSEARGKGGRGGGREGGQGRKEGRKEEQGANRGARTAGYCVARASRNFGTAGLWAQACPVMDDNGFRKVLD